MKSRREIFRLAGAAGAGALVVGGSPKPGPAPAPAGARPRVKPKALKPGDTLGLITPSSSVVDTGRSDLAVARLAASLPTGMGGCVAKYWEPSSPCSSPATNAK